MFAGRSLAGRERALRTFPGQGARRSRPDQKMVGSTVSWSIHRIAIAQRGPRDGAGR